MPITPNYFFYNQLQVYRKGFFSLFDDLYIKPFGVEGDEMDPELQKVNVLFSTKTKMEAMIRASTDDENFSVRSAFISIVPGGLTFDPTKERMINSGYFYQKDDVDGQFSLVPKAVTQSYSVHIIAGLLMDLDQIIEQLIPNLMPGTNLGYQFPWHPDPITTKVTVTSGNYDNNFNWDPTEDREVKYDIQCDQEIYLFSRLRDIKLVNAIEINKDFKE